MQNQHDYTHATEHKVKVKGTDPTWSWICSSPLLSFQEKKPKGTSCSLWTEVTHSTLWFLSSPQADVGQAQKEVGSCSTQEPRSPLQAASQPPWPRVALGLCSDSTSDLQPGGVGWGGDLGISETKCKLSPVAHWVDVSALSRPLI